MQLRFSGGDETDRRELLSEARLLLDNPPSWADEIARELLEVDVISDWHSHPWRFIDDNQENVRTAIIQVTTAHLAAHMD